jgi:hypothetical protein
MKIANCTRSLQLRERAVRDRLKVGEEEEL